MHSHPAWSHRPRKRRWLLLRFAFVFVPILIFFIAAMGVIFSLLFRQLSESMPRPGALGLVVCGVPLLFAAAASLFGGLAFRRIGTPLAEVMSAADAVAEGDLSVRVRENYPAELGQLARSFNRMAAELDRAEEQRRNFTADVAHELRTPLQIIQGNLEGILDGVYQPDREQIAATLAETRLLARLVSDLQTLSLAEAGQLPLHPALVSAADLLEDTATSFAVQAAAANISLAVDLPTDPAGLSIRVDPDRIDQVLSNLAANAIRMTPSGGTIRLRAYTEAAQVVIEVEDNGPGILSTDLPFLFDRFYRGDPARTRHPGTGSGLGLAIARQLVQAHGGSISAESPPTSGALFRIRLPRAAESPEPAPPAS